MAKKKTETAKAKKVVKKPARPSGGAAKKAPAKSTRKPSVKTAKAPAKTAKKTSKPAAKAPKKVSVPVKKDEAKKLADAVVDGILEKKGKNISVLDLRGIHNRVCDYFIICQADSNTQVNAIAGSVEEVVKKQTGEKPYRSEGFENAEWILIDYVTVVVHIFQSHIRNFYNLESLWADAEVTEIAFD